MSSWGVEYVGAVVRRLLSLGKHHASNLFTMMLSGAQHAYTSTVEGVVAFGISLPTKDSNWEVSTCSAYFMSSLI